MGFVIHKYRHYFLTGNLSKIQVSLADIEEYFSKACSGAINNGSYVRIKCGRDIIVITSDKLDIINQMVHEWLNDAYGMYNLASTESKQVILHLLERGNINGAKSWLSRVNQ